MPSMFGGDSTSKSYAPHMWIGDHFIHNSGKKVQTGDYWYNVGMVSGNKLVAERWPALAGEYGGGSAEIVPEEEIPQEVREAISPTAYGDSRDVMRKIAQQLQPGIEIDDHSKTI